MASCDLASCKFGLNEIVEKDKVCAIETTKMSKNNGEMLFIYVASNTEKAMMNFIIKVERQLNIDLICM